MDILSDVVTVMRTGRPVSARVEWHAPWTQRFAEVPGAAGFQVVLQGTCRIVGAEPLYLGVGDVVFLPHATEHVLANGDSATTVTLCGAYEVDPGRVHPLLLSLPGRIHLPARLGHSELRAAVDLLSAELENSRVGGDAVVPALLEALLLYILRAYFDDQPPAGWSGALKDQRITAALQAIHDEPGRQWTVASLAATAGMSRAPFARRFKELTGQPPLTYLTWWRMTTAGRLLRDTELSSRTIATRVGYASEFAFAHAFKRETGQAPGKFRSTVE
ncbi:AraC family transcriptional regulator [Kibdelosporangium lantanae]